MNTMTISRTAQRAYALQEWWYAKSATFTGLCATEDGEEFSHGDVVKAHLWGTVVFMLILVGGSL